jgi:1-acyl-sn-glycerol-3-phosphate acyltransferase
MTSDVRSSSVELRTPGLARRSAPAQREAPEPKLSPGAAVFRLWRRAGTCFAFVFFYVGCVTIILPAFVLAALSTRAVEVRARRLRRVIGFSMRGFTAMLQGLQLLSVAPHGLRRVNECRGTLIIANHPGLLDVVFLLAPVWQVDCVVKKALWRSAFTRACVAGADFIPNDEGPAVVAACVERLKRGHNVLLFPEGTRSPIGGLRVFHRGVARIALESGCDILPVLIRCTPPHLTKGTTWFHAPPVRPRYAFEVGEPLRARALVDPALELPAAVRRLTAHLQDYYHSKLGHDRP